MTSGLHHVTLVTRRVQANVDFYAGFLGLRLVKQTAGFADAAQLHLFYGDATGRPGSLVTFLVWEDGSPGRVGHGQVSEIALAVPPAAIGTWLVRALTAGLRPEGPVTEFGEPVLRLRDPDGIAVKLVGFSADGPAGGPIWTSSGLSGETAVRRLRSITLLSEMPEATVAFLTRHFGLRQTAAEGPVRRLSGDAGDAVDVRAATGFWPGLPGTGVADHFALRAPDLAAVTSAEAALGLNSAPTSIRDRKYFVSLYVREPAGALVEYATDGPGMLADEPADTLGTRLMVPPDHADETDALIAGLPQFVPPGAPRIAYRDLPFVHRFLLPEGEPAPERTLVLLHGSGGNEADLLALGRKVAPAARLLGIRGRSIEEGGARWFRRRRTGDGFDQADIRAEAEAFAAFLAGAARAYGLDPGTSDFLGLSNGASFLAAVMLLQPGLVQRAVLLRPAAVLDEPDQLPDLSGGRLLVLTGRRDPWAGSGRTLARILRDAGAAVEAREIEAGHGLVPEDVVAARAWLDVRGT